MTKINLVYISQTTNFVAEMEKELSKKEKILVAAEDLFSKNGYEATSTRSLAKEADVNLGMLTYYYGTKNKILEAIIETKMDFYKINVDKIVSSAQTYMQKLEAIIDIRLEHMMDNIKFHQIINNEILNDKHIDVQEYIIKRVKKNLETSCKIINEGIVANEFRPIDAQLFMMSIFGTINQYIKSEYMTLGLIGKSTKTDSITSIENKKRLRNYLKDYLHTYLKK